MKKFFVVLCLFLTLGVSNASNEEITEAECVDILKSVFASESVMKETLKVYPGLGKQKENLFRQHFYWVSNNDKLLRKLAHDFNQTGVLSSYGLSKPYEERKKVLQTTTQVMMENYYRMGLLKSSEEELREFSKMSLRMVKFMPYGHCRKYHFGPLDSKYYSQAIAVQGRLYKSLSVSEVRAYFSHFRRVVDNALDERKFKRELDSVALGLARKTLDNAVIRTFSKLPTEKRERLANALIYPETASDKDTCEAGNLVLKAVNSLDGQPFVLVTTYTLDETSK